MDDHYWNGTSYEILDSDANANLINFLKSQGVILEVEQNNHKYILYQTGDIVFNLGEFIDSKNYFTDFEDYFDNIDFSNNLKFIYYYEEYINMKYTNSCSKIVNFSHEVDKYGKVIKQNIINRNIKNLSVNLLREIENPSLKVKRLLKIFILLFLSTNTEITQNANDMIFSFRIQEDREVVEENTSFSEINIDTVEILMKIYDWIVDENGYHNTYKQRLEIIRSIIVRMHSFELNETIIEKAESIFKRIISQETDKYFEEVSLLKNDFLKITERENDIYQALHIKLIGWFSALALLVVDKVKDYSGHDLLNRLLVSDSQKTKLLLLLLICALIFISIIYILEIRKNQNEYEKLKEFYTNSLMFDGRDFEAKVEFPKIDDRYIAIIIGVLCILGLRIVFSSRSFVLYSVILIIVLIILFFEEYIKKICSKFDIKGERYE